MLLWQVSRAELQRQQHFPRFEMPRVARWRERPRGRTASFPPPPGVPFPPRGETGLGGRALAAFWSSGQVKRRITGDGHRVRPRSPLPGVARPRAAGGCGPFPPERSIAPRRGRQPGGDWRRTEAEEGGPRRFRVGAVGRLGRAAGAGSVPLSSASRRPPACLAPVPPGSPFTRRVAV